MVRRAVLTTILGALALLLSGSALAKGASEATITGPGLGAAIHLAGEGSPGGAQLMQLAEDAGFFSAVFQTVPNPMLSKRPDGELGPRYTIVYVMPGPAGPDRIRQDLYPYATPNPVTHTEPGQPYFGGQKTFGGWFVARPALRDDLVAAGLPATAPEGGVATGGPALRKADVLAAIAAGGSLGLVIVLAVRHSHATPV